MGCAVLTLLALFILLGSTSRAGLVSVAPIFWALLGVGIAANYRNGQQQKEDRRLEKADGQH